VIKPLARVALPVRPANGHAVAVDPDLIPLELPAPSPAERASRVSPALLLAVAQVLVIALLVWVELAQPPPQRGLTGIIFSNAIASSGAKAALHLYRDTFDWLPWVGDDYVLSPQPYIWIRRVGFLLLAATQLAALWVVTREERPSIRPWLFGPVFSMLLLLIYPPINTDVFYYAGASWVANEGGNPYLESPRAFGPNVFDRYSDWEHITVPYGPAWTGISRVVNLATDTSPLATSLGFKALLGLAAIGLALVTAHLARRLTGDPRKGVVAFVLVAWSPIVLYESAATAHLDPLLMLVALGGLALVTSPKPGRFRGGLLLIALSALFKPVTLPLLGLAALVRLARRGEPFKAIARRWVLDVAVVLALAVVAFAPYWGGGRLPGAMLDNQRTLYVEKPLRSNPFWIWLAPRLGFSGGWLPEDGAKIAQGAAILFVAGAVFWLVRREVLLRQRPALPDPSPTMLLRWQLQSWAVVMVALAYLPPNAHSWYMIWALPLMTLLWVDRARLGRDRPPVTARVNGHTVEAGLAERHIPWPIVVYFAWSFVSFFVYHTWARG
jgi:hypothetical protein